MQMPQRRSWSCLELSELTSGPNIPIILRGSNSKYSSSERQYPRPAKSGKVLTQQLGVRKPSFRLGASVGPKVERCVVNCVRGESKTRLLADGKDKPNFADGGV